MKRFVVLMLLGAVIGGSIWYFLHSYLDILSQVRVDRITQAGKLIVATDPSYAPMEFVDDNGELAGFDIDLMHEIARELGVELDVRILPWDDIFPALQQGEVDMVMSSISITTERSKTMRFSNPYLSAGQVMVVAADDSTIYDPEDMAGKVVVAQVDTTGAAEAAKYSQQVRTDIYDLDMLAKEITTGAAEVLVMDYPAAVDLVKKHSNLMIANDPFTVEFYGVVFQKDDVELQEAVNHILVKLKIDGVLQALQQKWLLGNGE